VGRPAGAYPIFGKGNRMDPKQAMSILADVCQQFHGTLADHNNIQTALATVGKIVLSAPVKPAPAAPVKPE